MHNDFSLLIDALTALQRLSTLSQEEKQRITIFTTVFLHSYELGAEDEDLSCIFPESEGDSLNKLLSSDMGEDLKKLLPDAQVRTFVHVIALTAYRLGKRH